MRFAGKTVVLCVTGGIAAYKAADLTSKLHQNGAEVRVLMTESAAQFISPMTFETLSGSRAVVDTFDRSFPWEVEHISLAKAADVFVIAPATANVIAKAAHGIADDSDAYMLARQGLDTLAMIVDEAALIRPGAVIADLKIARGLDYYTGSVYETFLDGAASLGSICSGGRYDNLASQGNRKYPGVGLSIGLSRLVSYMLHSAGAHASRVCPASVLVAVWNEQDRSAANLIANTLRSRGIAADVAPTAAKLGKQIKYADKLGIPYVWFPAGATDGDDTASDEVKNIVTGDQQPADPKSWQPDTVYARQTVVID